MPDGGAVGSLGRFQGAARAQDGVLDVTSLGFLIP